MAPPSLQCWACVFRDTDSSPRSLDHCPRPYSGGHCALGPLASSPTSGPAPSSSVLALTSGLHPCWSRVFIFVTYVYVNILYKI